MAHNDSDPTTSVADHASALLAGVRTPADLAAVIRNHEGLREILIRVAQPRYGNAFVGEALGLATLTDAQARAATPGELDTTALRGEMGGPDDMLDDNGELHHYDAAGRLPFTPSGWSATELLRNLGQRDTMAATDSDGSRCVQAVGIASHVLRGPGATIAYLQAMLADPVHGATTPSPRQVSGRAVLARVCERLRDRSATYQDLSWAQEALHDLTNSDTRGTNANATVSEIAPSTTTDTQVMHQWCNTPREVLEAAAALREGEQLMATEVLISWNSAIIAHNISDGTRDTSTEVSDESGTTRTVQEARLSRGERPDPSRADTMRDAMSGHQMLIVRQQGELRLYDPETHGASAHYVALTPAVLARWFHPVGLTEGQFGYMRIDGKITPR